MSSEPVGYTLTFWGVTFTLTFQGVMSIIGMAIGIAGIIMSYMSLKERRLSRLESKRANDLKEEELNAKAKDS